MSRRDNFSTRNGHGPDLNTPITMRNDVPDDLRGFLVDLAYENGIKHDALRSMVCRRLRVAPDTRNNWGPDNVDREIRDLLVACPWFDIYDLIEVVALHLETDNYREYGADFENEINEFFIARGVGWKLEKGKIVFRGDEGLDRILAVAATTENLNGYLTASNELHEAIKDLSRRPTPDVTGAIQHAMASLECVARDLTDSKETLGAWLKRNREAFPPPLADITDKLWGYASNHGRHLKEAEAAKLEEAELILGICATLGSYLANKGKALANLQGNVFPPVGWPS
ncbi:AbiJ-NTD4 domain-containing protein [Massilia sp. TWP1-3-3]|uniref:AbiJ-NTD4 domain-containing protein n=1 Tax=Massilia sp. TWP1-3-3 TaxID=2804573 RepID=UPI003CEB66FA